MSASFSSLPLSPAELSNLDSLEYQKMTPIQAQSLPVILAGKDLLAQAQTGSGKTAAFGIGVLNALSVPQYHSEVLILCPTRELADQVSKELRRLARAIPNTKIVSLCGGKPMGPQLASLEHKPHLVVGTPGRVLKHLQKGTLKLDHLKTLVLDEADRMLDMGFSDDIKRVISFIPNNRQTLLFSATYPPEIKKISQSVQNNPVDIRIKDEGNKADIKQHFYEVSGDQRAASLAKVLGHFQPDSCVIFCNRKHQCDEVAEQLASMGASVKALHGDLEQKDRDRVLAQFANRSCSFLVATDVAARGLDIKDLPMVINYELSHDPEVHVHRIGRTGRAGKKGLAVSLYQPSELRKIMALEDYLKFSVESEDITRLSSVASLAIKPPMVTLAIHGGRKDKLRAGDLLGALTADKSIAGNQIGKIDLFDFATYVAVERQIASLALNLLNDGKIKGRKFKVRIVN